METKTLISNLTHQKNFKNRVWTVKYGLRVKKQVKEMSLTSFVRFSSSDEVVSSGHFQPDSKVSQKTHGPNMLTTQVIKSGEKDMYLQELQC